MLVLSYCSDAFVSVYMAVCLRVYMINEHKFHEFEQEEITSFSPYQKWVCHFKSGAVEIESLECVAIKLHRQPFVKIIHDRVFPRNQFAPHGTLRGKVIGAVR